MLHDQSLPKFLWAEVANTVVYVQNRCPHQALDSKTLKEVFTGKKSNVSHFRIFGSQKKREVNWMHLGRNEHLWATVKLLRHIESMCLVKEKWR